MTFSFVLPEAEILQLIRHHYQTQGYDVLACTLSSAVAGPLALSAHVEIAGTLASRAILARETDVAPVLEEVPDAPPPR